MGLSSTGDIGLVLTVTAFSLVASSAKVPLQQGRWKALTSLPEAQSQALLAVASAARSVLACQRRAWERSNSVANIDGPGPTSLAVEACACSPSCSASWRRVPKVDGARGPAQQNDAITVAHNTMSLQCLNFLKGAQRKECNLATLRQSAKKYVPQGATGSTLTSDSVKPLAPCFDGGGNAYPLAKLTTRRVTLTSSSLSLISSI